MLHQEYVDKLLTQTCLQKKIRGSLAAGTKLD